MTFLQINIVQFWFMYKGIICIYLLIIVSCAEVDYFDDPIVGERIVVEQQQIALMSGQMNTVMASYFDQYGIPQDVTFVWSSTVPSVATVNSQGKVTAFMDGQTVVQPSYNGFAGPPVNVTVVSDLTSVALVQVTAPKTNLAQGEKVQLTSSVRNINSEVLPGKTVEWFSENSSIITVSASGEVTAVGQGVAEIHAKSEGVKSNSIVFTISTSRDGSFVPAGGYQARGTAILKNENNQLILELSSDFQTSFALGTYIYLANSTNGGTVKTSGFEVAQISTNGAKSFNITQINPNINLFDYRYVIILCKPAGLTFGFADLN
jgi:hypothetical protein